MTLSRSTISYGAAVSIVVVETFAVTCQFLQTTDDRFPLLYFTVDSAIFAAIVAFVALVWPTSPRLPSLRLCSTVSVLLAAIVFATAIAPASPTGTWIQPHDDLWVRTATVLFHLVAPVLVTVDWFLHNARPGSYRSAVLRCYAWPLSYLLAVCGLAALGMAELPYPFLDPHAIGPWAAIGAIGALALIIAVLGTALSWLNSLRRRTFR